jgi:hypothetical protein
VTRDRAACIRDDHRVVTCLGNGHGIFGVGRVGGSGQNEGPQLPLVAEVCSRRHDRKSEAPARCDIRARLRLSDDDRGGNRRAAAR